MGRCHFLGLVLQFGLATSFRSEVLQPPCGDIQLTLDDILYLSTPHLGPGTVFSYGEYCTWTIISPANTKIKLIFETFMLEHHPTCAIDYVTISNGNCDNEDPDDPRYCGVVLPPVFVSATNVICLKIASSMYTTQKGFILKAESITEGITKYATTKTNVTTQDATTKASVTTKDATTNTSVTIKDATTKASVTTKDVQKNASVTTEDATAKASVTTEDATTKASVTTEDATTKTRVTTEDATTNASFTTQGATIQTSITKEKSKVQSILQTKASSLAHLLGTYNSTLAGLKTTFKSPLGSLTLSASSAIHHSNMSISSSGGLETIELCNITGTFLTYNDIFVTSPNFGDNQKYPVTTTCTTTFSTSVGYKMKIEFIHFDIEGNRLCSWDSLQVFDGADETANMIRNLCGTYIPDSFSSTGHEIFFKFVSDNIIPKSGFKAKISILTADENTQRTPTSPSDTNTNVSSTVTPFSQTEIELSAISSRSTPMNASLTSLRSMTTTNHTPSGSVGKTGSTVETIPISLTPSTQVSSLSAFSSTVPAFDSKVYEMCATTESITIVDNFLHLASPGFDEYSMYPTSILCTVSLQADIGSKLEISFLHFDVEGNSLCSWDSLQIFDGANDTWTLIGNLCGSTLPGPLASTGRFLFLKFVSDEIIAKTGFKAKIDLVQGVDETRTTKSGTLTSVSPATEKLTTGTLSSLSSITFLRSLYSSLSSTHHSKVVFPSGIGTTTTILANIPPLSSTPVPSYQTEQIHMCSVDKLTVYKSITVLSPKDNDTGMYPTSIICGLTIISKSYALHIEFEQFDVEYQQYCMWDYLEIYDGPSTESPLKSRYCGSDIPSPTQTSGREVSFRFQSDHTVPRSGFKLNVYLINNSPGLDEQTSEFTQTYTNTLSPLSSLKSRSTTVSSLNKPTLAATPAQFSTETSTLAIPAQFSTETSTPTTLSRFSTEPSYMLTTAISQSDETPNNQRYTTTYKHATTPVLNTTQTTISISDTQLKTLAATPAQFSTETSTLATPAQFSTETSTLTTPAQFSKETSTLAIPAQFSTETSTLATPAQFSTGTSTLATPAQFSMETSTLATPEQFSTETSTLATPAQFSTETSTLATPAQFSTETSTLATPAQFSTETSTLATPAQFSTETSTLAIPAQFSTETSTPTTLSRFSTEPSYMLTTAISQSDETPNNQRYTTTYKHATTPVLNTTQTTISISDTQLKTLAATPAQFSTETSTLATPAQFSTETSTLTTPAQFSKETSTLAIPAQFSTETSTLATPAQFSTETSTLATPAQFSTETSTLATPAQFSTETSTLATPAQFSTETSTLATPAQFSKEASTITTLSRFSTEPSDVSTTAIRKSDETPNNQRYTTTYKHAITPVTNTTQTTISISDTQLTTPNLGYGLPQACRGESMKIVNSSGIIDSPGLQSNKKYPHSVNCTWSIIGLTGNRISVHFEVFELEESDNCSKDSVTVYKNTIQDSNLIGRYCGRVKPFEIYTMEGRLLIHFTADEGGSERGFMANYTIETPPFKITDCPIWQRACNEGICIPDEWFCDSIEDCAVGEDEANCAICLDTQFQCDYTRCIAANQRCNGIHDCQDKTDEDFCVSITNINGSLRIMYENKWYPVCGVGWTTAMGHALCKMAEYREMASVSFLPLKVNTTIILINSTYNIHQNIKISDKCQDAREVNLICKENGCGTVNKSIRKARVVGGDRSAPGEWPWVVAIRAGEKVTCGGTLISNQWVATAGHCMASLQDSTHLASVLVGTHNVMTDDIHAVGVTEIVMHPDYEFIYNADLALLRLQRPLVISYNVRPVCLPWDRRHFTNSTLCYIAGWGITDMKDYYITTASEYLHHARTKIWIESDCRKAYSSKAKDSMFCAGYNAGGIDACKGDSGGPLMCQIEDNRWVLTGITSWGEKCGQPGLPGVYTDVASYLDWIDSVMGYIVVNVSCDFESVNICGYLEMSNGSFLWTRRLGGFSSNIKPSVDATTNGVNGHYVFAEVSPGQTSNNNQAVLLSPPISGDKQKCLSFAFMFSGRSDLVLKVYGHRGDYNETGFLEEAELLWVMKSEFSTWRRSKTSLPANVTHVTFVVTLGIKTNVGVALDDVFIESSSCADQDMYRCSFDDGTLCQFQQATDDYLDWVLRSTATEDVYKIIPKSSWSGYYLEFRGSQIARGDKATFLSRTINDNLPHCLNMYYKIYPRLSGSLSVILRVEFGSMHVYGDAMWTTRESTMSTWTWVAVDLPSRMYGIMVAIQGKRESYAGDFEILVDDVYIYEGNCRVT